MADLVGWMKKITFVATLLWPSLWHTLLSSSSSPTSLFVSAVPVQIYGLNYNSRKGPDWDPNRCKSREEIVTDLTLLKRITNRIRILSLTDCDGGQIVLDVVKELGMQTWLGLWVGSDDATFLGEKAFLENLLATGQITEPTVLGVTVGSESIFRGEVSASKNIEFMNQIKDILTDAGFGNLPVSIVDIVQTYIGNPSLATAVDVIYANIFPYWANISLENAVPSLLFELGRLYNQQGAQGKKFIFGETGWPSQGSREGIQEGSIEGQIRYFEDFYCEIGVRYDFEYFYFTGIDNAWRQIQEPDNPVEGNWGILFSDLTIKPHFENLEFQCDADNINYSFAEIDWTIPGTSEITPAPVAATSAPVAATPAPITAAPITASPVLTTPAPITLSPISTPAPNTSSPIATPAPITSSPVMAPITLSPVTMAPVVVTSAPVTMAPIITPAPISPAPVTMTPSTSAPESTSAPTEVGTSSPTTMPTSAPSAADDTSSPTSATSTPTSDEDSSEAHAVRSNLFLNMYAFGCILFVIFVH